MLNPADPVFVAHLASLLPEGVIRPAEPRHVEDPRGRGAGVGGCVALPGSTEEVSIILRTCNEAGVGVVPWGGGTGLVGGQVMPDGVPPVILSLERMRAVRGVHPQENVIVVEAGLKLAEVRAAAAEAGRMFPLSIAAEGTASIGGNLATNAGGVNVIRWGNMRELCLGVEAVMADGSIMRGLRRLRKDNTGYDIRNLLVGSEGTLGVITAAALRLVAPPPVTGVALMVVDSPSDALALLALTESRVSGGVSAFELIHGQGLEFMAEKLPQIRLPFPADAIPQWFVLLELGLPQGLSADEAFEGLFEAALEAGLVSDGIIAQNATQAAEFWNVREHIPEANRSIGAISSHDVSLPLSELPGFLERADRAVGAIGDFRINAFGHLGDGNLHYNIFPPLGRSRAEFPDEAKVIKQTVHDLVDACGGSVSAEHGIGRWKTDDVVKYGDPVRVALMRQIKAVMDPKGILNPGAVLA